MGSRNKSFFLKRWVQNIGDALDRWLYSASYQGALVGCTHWRVFVVGMIAGGIFCIESAATDGQGFISLCVGGVVAFIVAIIYLWKTLQAFPSFTQKLLRALFVVTVCALGFATGFLLGLVAMMLVVAVVVLFLFLKILSAMLGGSGSTSSSSSVQRSRERYTLDDGTEVEEIGNGVYEDVAGYTRYRKGTFTDEFTKID